MHRRLLLDALIAVVVVAPATALALQPAAFALLYAVRLAIPMLVVAPCWHARHGPGPGGLRQGLDLFLVLSPVWLGGVLLPLAWAYGDASLPWWQRAGAAAITHAEDLLWPLLALGAATAVSILQLYLTPRSSEASRNEPRHFDEGQTWPLLHRMLALAFFIFIGPLMLNGLVSDGFTSTQAIVLVYLIAELWPMLGAALRPGVQDRVLQGP